MPDLFELDREVRQVLQNVVRNNVLSSAIRLIDLGFSAKAAFNIVLAILEKR